MVGYAHFIPLFPLLAFVINIFFGHKIKKASALVAISASALSFVFSVITFARFLAGNGSYTLGKWVDLGALSFDFGILVDPLSCTMLLVVTIIGTLIQIYSIGYMHDDRRFSRFFAYLSLFMASMLGLLIADNLLMLFMCWEGVGLCSYLLISFWFEKISAAKAGMKAFITTRVGDIGLFVGMLILFSLTGTFNFSQMQLAEGSNIALFTVAAFLVFSGAMGKSAQFPLHVWLPDAMEGPTPVSALIHAATMVAAGVYLVGRMFWLFSAHQLALTWVACIGATTALFAASIALVNNDIKRILAYSTISQLGFMMMGLGVGGYSAGLFHLVTHAFFKALLFLCAGSVIHAVHTQDIQKMGGLLSKLKVTGDTFIIGSLAISGIPPFAGFWSKDEILSEALSTGHPVLFMIGSLTSLFTAFYMFRLIFMVLFGKTRSELHPHESPKVMTIPLSILAVFAIFIGLIGSPLTHYAFQKFIHFQPKISIASDISMTNHAEKDAMQILPKAAYGGAEESAKAEEGHSAELAPNYFVMGLSTLIALLGMGLAFSISILNNKLLPVSVRSKFTFLYNILYNKYYIDELYEAIFIKPIGRLSKISFKFDSNVIDGAVNGTAKLMDIISRIKAWIDSVIVDGIVNWTARIIGMFSSVLRLAHTGYVQGYLFLAFAGILFIIIIKFMGGITCIFRY